MTFVKLGRKTVHDNVSYRKTRRYSLRTLSEYGTFQVFSVRSNSKVSFHVVHIVASNFRLSGNAFPS
jgi:hypothetical protein